MWRNIEVREWMSHPAITVTAETPVAEAHRLMTQNNIRRLPVVESDDLVGIVTIGNIREARPSDATSLSVWEINTLWDELRVGQIMTRDVITIHLTDSIYHAAEVMLENKISGLPVVGALNNLVGVLTESDIFRMVIRLHAEEAAPR